MNLKNYKPLFSVLVISILLYILHKIGFFFFDKNSQTAGFHYTLEVIYLFFTTLSVVIIAVLLIVKQKSFDNVGMTFLLITSIKMILCYLFFMPVLKSSNQNNTFEKFNFFGLFILFLAVETIETIRFLNNKK